MSISAHPRGKAKAHLTGASLFLASLGAACLLCALLAAVTGPARRAVGRFVSSASFSLGITGLFSGEMIRECQRFELRKLVAELVGRS
jgi:hypothetical protein